MEWQCYAWRLTPSVSSGRFCQWSVIPCHLCPFVEFQIGGKWLLGTSSRRVWRQQLCMVVLPPTWIRTPLLPICTRNPRTLGMVPWSRCPKRRIVRLGYCLWGALYCELLCHPASGIFNTFGWILWCLHTLLARRKHFARNLLELWMLHSGLHMLQCGISRWFVWLLLQVRIISADHLSIPCIGMDRPRGVDGSRRSAFSCSPLVANILQP